MLPLQGTGLIPDRGTKIPHAGVVQQKTPKDLLHINTDIFMKNNYFKIFKKLARRVALFNLFANLCKVWLNRKLDSEICLCIQFVVVSLVVSGKTLQLCIISKNSK